MNIVDIKIINNDILLSRLKALRLCKGLLLYTHTYKCNIIKLNSYGGTFMYVVNTIKIS